MHVFVLVPQLLAAYLVAGVAGKTCHRDSGSKRVYNGHDSKIEDNPYLVQILIKEWILYYPIGAGAIIGLRSVLTCSHVLKRGNFTKENYAVRSGTSYSRGPEASEGILHEMESLSQHEGYRPDGRVNDIAILLIVDSFKFSDTTKPIAIAMTSPTSGAKGIIGGWGAVDANSTKHLPVLQTATVPIFTRDECIENTAWEDRVFEEHFCAGGNSMTRKGDSGSPIVWEGKIAGIVARGITIYDPEYPTLFTNVTYHLDWVKATLAKLNQTDVKYL